MIYYHLEDDTIYIGEPKIENSGIPQGVFLKRHKVPRASGEGTYHWTDLNVSIEVDIYA